MALASVRTGRFGGIGFVRTSRGGPFACSNYKERPTAARASDLGAHRGRGADTPSVCNWRRNPAARIPFSGGRFSRLCRDALHRDAFPLIPHLLPVMMARAPLIGGP